MSDADIPFTLDQLRIVKAIAECGSFRKAAERLFISQPAVSLQVQNLEKQLQVMLFERGSRRVTQTEAGSLLVEYSEKILNLSEEACRALVDLQELKRGTLALGASQTVGTYVMPKLIGEFRRTHPHITVQLQVLSTRRISQAVLEGRLDLAIVGGTVPSEASKQLELIPYARDQFVLVVANPESSNAQFSFDLPVRVVPGEKSYIPREDLYKLPFITLNSQSTTKKVIDAALDSCGIDPTQFRVEMELSSLEAIKNAVKAGLGAAFLSLTAVGSDLTDGLLYRLFVRDLEVERDLNMIYNPHRYQSQVARTFRRELFKCDSP
ncbi:MAG: LysR substrate-binding domain-containing protein [Cyanobacteria bacterium J06639_1]